MVAFAVTSGWRPGVTPVHPPLLRLWRFVVAGVALGALSHALAIACREQQESFYMIQSSIQFPLLFLSGLMLPLEAAPGWMEAAGRLNPLTYVVEALRALFDGRVVVGDVGWGVAVVAALAGVGLAVGTRAMRRANA